MNDFHKNKNVLSLKFIMLKYKKGSPGKVWRASEHVHKYIKRWKEKIAEENSNRR